MLRVPVIIMKCHKVRFSFRNTSRHFATLYDTLRHFPTFPGLCSERHFGSRGSSAKRVFLCFSKRTVPVSVPGKRFRRFRFCFRFREKHRSDGSGFWFRWATLSKNGWVETKPFWNGVELRLKWGRGISSPDKTRTAVYGNHCLGKTLGDHFGFLEKRLQGLKSWAWLPKFCRAPKNHSSTGILLPWRP